MNVRTGARTHRIIEIEWAIKNDRPFAPSPKKPRRGPSRRAKSGSSKHRPAPDADEDDDAPDSGKENEGYADAEDKEEGGSAKRRRRHVKSEEREREPGTPPKRRRLVKFEDAYA